VFSSVLKVVDLWIYRYPHDANTGTRYTQPQPRRS